MRNYRGTAFWMMLAAALAMGACSDDGGGPETGGEAGASSGQMMSGEESGPNGSSGGPGPTTGVATSDGSTGSMDGDSSSGGGSTGGPAFECPPPANSMCGNGNSIIAGRARLSDALPGAPTTGNLVVVLSHLELGGGAGGGVLHWAETVPAADLTGEGVEFSLDMCLGGEMWSEENCGYQLVVILDQNGNNGSTNFLPDPGEPSTTIDLSMSCNGPPPCLDLVLDCADGGSCASFVDPPYCSCAPPHTCGSPIVAC